MRKIKDVVKVTGFINEIPLLQFSHRKGQIINMGGVHLTTEHIQKSIKDLEKKTNVLYNEYSR